MIKKCSCTFYFLLVVLILFLFGLQFLQRGLMFHYIHTFIMFKHAAFGKHTWIHTSKIKKNKLILKFHPRMKCLHVFFSSQDEISSRQKRVNSKRHFTIDRDDFIPGLVMKTRFTSKFVIYICHPDIHFRCIYMVTKNKKLRNVLDDI